jgi:CRISPR-associated protein Csx14
MIATLGGQPQVVTFALDALLEQGVAIGNVLVLHLSPAHQRVARSLDKLDREFGDGRYGDRAITFRSIPIRAEKRPLADIYDEADANVAWETVNRLLRRLKRERRTLHICISGGRRIMGLLTMSAAMLHFAHQDTLWHMYTPDAIQQRAAEGAMMHLPPDSGFRLIRVPMMPWGSYFPALRELAQPSLSEDVLARPRHMLDEMERRRCQQVMAQLTDRQQDVLAAFAQGSTPQQVAEKLFISVKTVDTHKTKILAECRNAWELPEDQWLDYRFLGEKFAGLSISGEMKEMGNLLN